MVDADRTQRLFLESSLDGGLLSGKHMLPTLNEIRQAAGTVYTAMQPTPQYAWPLLCAQLGAEIWVKHENHTPIGSFKIRGGLVYFESLAGNPNSIRRVITATRGNHGQSVAYAARRYGIPATIVVPRGNSREKNAAMCALGAELVEHGEDFQESLDYAQHLAREKDLHMVPSCHRLLVTGVATAYLELLEAVPELETVYIPIGLGSGICAMLAAKGAVGSEVEVVGVVSRGARAYAESFTHKTLIEVPVSTQLADGMACRTPNAEALAEILSGADRLIEVSDEEVGAAMRLLFECTHNAAEGAGAAALAGAVQEKARIGMRRVGVVLTGGNIDCELFARVLGGKYV